MKRDYILKTVKEDKSEDEMDYIRDELKKWRKKIDIYELKQLAKKNKTKKD
jgi:hypothetical protein